MEKEKPVGRYGWSNCMKRGSEPWRTNTGRTTPEETAIRHGDRAQLGRADDEDGGKCNAAKGAPRQPIAEKQQTRKGEIWI